MLTPEVVKEIERRFKKLNPGIVAYYNKIDEEKSFVRDKRWRKSHRDELYRKYGKLGYVKERRSADRDRRRAKEKGGGSYTIREWEAVKINYAYRCAYCGCKPKHLTKDHIIPLCKGGSNTIYNIIPACGRCNGRKGINGLHPLILPLWQSCLLAS